MVVVRYACLTGRRSISMPNFILVNIYFEDERFLCNNISVIKYITLIATYPQNIRIVSICANR